METIETQVKKRKEIINEIFELKEQISIKTSDLEILENELKWINFQLNNYDNGTESKSN